MRRRLIVFVSSEWITLLDEKNLSAEGIYRGVIEIPKACSELLSTRDVYSSGWRDFFVDCILNNLGLDSYVKYVIYVDAEFDNPYIVLVREDKLLIYRLRADILRSR